MNQRPADADAEARVREALEALARREMPLHRVLTPVQLAKPVLAAIRAAAGAAVDIPWDVLYSRVQGRALDAAVRALTGESGNG